MTKQNKLPVPLEGESKIDLFRRKEIRKTLHDKEWWFSVKDVLEALAETTDGNRYSRDLRKKDSGLKSTWAEITRTLAFKTETRGVQMTTFIDIEGLFRLMQSVPTKKAEPFKRWLARVGFERLQEIQNPELAVKRAITIYRSKGYEDKWIETRIKNKASRETLTAEWYKRGMKPYIGLLTDSISIKTFGIRTSEHRNLKGLKRHHPLRDNMTPIELTLTTLGEQATTEITKATDAKGLEENKKAAERGGEIAGSARKQIESATNNKVVSKENYLTDRQQLSKPQSKNLDQALQQLLSI